MSRRFLMYCLFVCGSVSPGCESDTEGKELLRDRDNLRIEQQIAQQELDRFIAGRATLTEAEKAVAGTLFIKLKETKWADFQVEEQLKRNDL